MWVKTTPLLTTTMLSLVVYGLSTSPVLANSSPVSLQGMPSHYGERGISLAATEVGLPKTKTLIAANITDPSPTNTVTSVSSNQNIPGIINSYDESSVEIKLADGTLKKYQLNPNLVNSPNIRKGAFASLVVDGNQVVQEAQGAEVEKTVKGTVKEIDGSQVKLELPDGTIENTTISPAASARMGLAAGSPLMVTYYKGLSATKVCLVKTIPPAISLPPVIEKPPIVVPPIISLPPATNNPPVGGGEPPPIPARW